MQPVIMLLQRCLADGVLEVHVELEVGCAFSSPFKLTDCIHSLQVMMNPLKVFMADLIIRWIVER